MTKNLWLFDIDGTLVNINDIHVASYRMLYNDVLGRHVSEEIILGTFGMSEQEMHKSVFNNLKIHYEVSIVNELLQNRPQYFVKALDSKKIEPLDGVVEFLSYLKNNQEYLSAVTGNQREPAEIILEKSNLKEFFSILSYDDDTSTRTQILERAIKEARKRNYDFSKVIVVGDTIRDTEAGKYINADFIVAVATGTDGLSKLEQELEKSNVNGVVVPNLKDYMRIVSFVDNLK